MELLFLNTQRARLKTKTITLYLLRLLLLWLVLTLFIFILIRGKCIVKVKDLTRPPSDPCEEALNVEL